VVACNVDFLEPDLDECFAHDVWMKIEIRLI
jgi:hypothetical protein